MTSKWATGVGSEHWPDNLYKSSQQAISSWYRFGLVVNPILEKPDTPGKTILDTKFAKWGGNIRNNQELLARKTKMLIEL